MMKQNLTAVFLAAGLMLMASRAHSQEWFGWNAAQDVGGDGIWSSTTTNAYNWTFDSGSQTPVAVADARFASLAKAYVYPAAASRTNTSWDAFGSWLPTSFEFVLDADSDNGLIFEAGGSGDGIAFDITNGILKGTIAEATNVTVTYTLTPEDKARFIHVVLVADGTSDTLTLYVDGQLRDTATWARGGDWPDWAGPDLAGLGGSGSSKPIGSVTGDFMGKIALFRFYRDRALSEIEVDLIFRSLTQNSGINPDSRILPPSHIVSGVVTGRLVVIDVPYVGSGGVSGGPLWTANPTWGSTASVMDNGFKTVNNPVQGPDGNSNWEPDGTPFAEAKGYFTFGNGPVPSVEYVFNKESALIDIPDGAVINAVYATWNTRSNDGITWQYTEEATSNSYVNTQSSPPTADLVLSWTDADDVTRNGNFQRIFSGPILVEGDDGFTVRATDNRGNAAHLDAMVIDVTLPPTGTVLIVR